MESLQNFLMFFTFSAVNASQFAHLALFCGQLLTDWPQIFISSGDAVTPCRDGLIRPESNSIQSSAAPLPFRHRLNCFSFPYSLHTHLSLSINPSIPLGKHKHANKAEMQRLRSFVCMFELVGKSIGPRGRMLFDASFFFSRGLPIKTPFLHLWSRMRETGWD